MSVADCAAAGLLDRGCKHRLRNRGWVAEDDGENRFPRSLRVAEEIWRGITFAATRRAEERGRKKALREKVRKAIDDSACWLERRESGGNGRTWSVW